MRIRFAPMAAAAALMSMALVGGALASSAPEGAWPAKTEYHYRDVDGVKIFYREAGDPAKPTIVLLHGFPTTSHAYRELIPLLSGEYHVIAPDYPGSGYSDHPDPDVSPYTFDFLASRVAGLIDGLGIRSYALYMHDFGAPVGFRLMMRQPGKLDALIVQNANAYLEGLGAGRQAFFRKAHEDTSAEEVAFLLGRVSRDAIVKTQYLRDVKGRESIMSPDSWTLDLAFLATDRDRKIQVQLLQDYYSNLLAYPRWQQFLHEKQPPTLIVWGKNDPSFIADGAKAYLKDVPRAELHLLDAGHFAVEEKPGEIAQYILGFMRRLHGARMPA